VAGQLGIPFYVVDARAVFESHVIAPFVRGYAHGDTPNPCIECNRTVRFGFLLEHALSLGATHLATGHYARVERVGRAVRLRTARDQAKDQSYVLHSLTQAQLSAALFPLGEMTKEQVRSEARRLRLTIADRPESQDLCFVHGDYRAFLASRGIVGEPGPIVDRAGEVLGRHTGLERYTLGQRKGVGIPSHAPLYVVEKDLERNALVVGPREQIGLQAFSVDRVNWIAGAPPAERFDAFVRVRYHAPLSAATVTCTAAAEAHVELAARDPDVAPGQSAVFYLDDECLGGGIIRL
jgi:tRNA-specific 2-thiouridylase